MESLSELYQFLKGKNKDELVALIDKEAKELVKKYGFDGKYYIT